ncbi:mitochondrial Rho GTPase 1 isoform X1 [Populus alba]
MAKAATTANPGVKSGVRIVVAGDRGTGKSSLIVTAISETFPSSVPPVLPPTRMPDDFYPDRVPITIIDTSSKVEDASKVAEELKRADAVVLTYACDRPETLDRLSTFWLPELRQLEVKVPVIVVGCKLDLRDENQQVSLEQVMSPIMQQFREIETCIECSAFKHIQIPEVFYYAQKAVLHPTGPLFDQESQTLKPRCVRALKRIFILCDLDRDGALSDAELNEFQVKCFNAPLQPSEIIGVKRVVEEKLPGGGVSGMGVNDCGLTLTGFLFLHALFIEKGRLETTWTVLRKFGYNNDIKLSDELIPTFKLAPDQSVELTSEAVEYLRNIYELFDSDGDNNLRPAELEDIFSTAPESPWEEPPYKDAAEKTALGGLSANAFLSEWALMTLLDPSRAVENLIYIGYSGDPSAAVRLTRRRRLDRKKKQSDRNVFHCFVFGPKKSGKSALVNSFIGRPFYDSYAPTAEEIYAVNVVDLPGVSVIEVGIKKTLVLREIPDGGVKKLLSNKESLASCDIAVFVYDSSDQSSWKRATELLVDVASHGEDTGYEVPCLIVAAKDDLNSFPMAIQESTRVSQDMGIEAPIPISSKMGDTNNVFRRIVTAAEHPHLSIPETEAGRSRKQYNRLVNRSLMFVSVGAAVAIVGLAAYRVYAARKNSSG